MQRRKESNSVKKDFFLKFRVQREDVSSASGEVEGWLSADAVPLKGTIKDVIFFGDLWGIDDYDIAFVNHNGFSIEN